MPYYMTRSWSKDWIRCFKYPIQCNITWKNARKSEGVCPVVNHAFFQFFFQSTPHILHEYFTCHAFIYGETPLGVLN
uniref:Uncharacterized protein n=1 Tax=Populus trichocarpa TaxID=3694 RepID=A0A2K1XQQ0_POPTR